MKEVTFNKAGAVILWALLGLFGKRQYCQACGQRVTPKNVGGFSKGNGTETWVWHSSLPCIIGFINTTNIRQLSGKENGKP